MLHHQAPRWPTPFAPNSITEIDEAALLREARRRFGRELTATTAFAREAAVHPDPAMPARAVERLDPLGELHRVLGSSPTAARIHQLATELCVLLFRCSADPTIAPISFGFCRAAVGGWAAGGIRLVIIALLPGEGAGGALPTDGRVTIEAWAEGGSVFVMATDLASEPPGRLALGGGMLRGVLAAVPGAGARTATPGLATATIVLPPTGRPGPQAVGHA